MQYKIEVRPLAALEIIEAYDWYELQKAGLGLEFLNELDQFRLRRVTCKGRCGLLVINKSASRNRSVLSLHTQAYGETLRRH